MRRRLLAVLSVGAMVAALAAGVAPASGAAAKGSYRHLDPGGPARFREKVPVNLVFVGYERDQVRKQRFLAGLPSRYQPVNRNRLIYGVTERLGISYSYDYDVTYASSGYERRFFSTLSRLAEPAPLTELQQAYNDQQNNVLEVTDNHHIDAPTVERWLADHPPAGVDTRQNTIFFVNWYGRPDFKFHVYTKTDEPDPDTGFNFGVETQSRKLIAWGGTTPDDEENGLGRLRRVWFYDLSAGPESWTDNWNVDDADLDGDDVPDYRMPPIWEYTQGGFRAPSALSGDLGKVARYVGINLLFTSSPSYPPVADPARPAAHASTSTPTPTRPCPGVDASRRYIKPRLLLQELSELQRTTRFSYDNQDLPFTGQAQQCYELWLQPRTSPATPTSTTRPSPTCSCSTPSTWSAPRTTPAGSTTSCPTSTTPPPTTRRERAPRLRRRQLPHRHPELRVQLRLARGRRDRLRADHDDDPRGRPPPGHEPSARRLRLGDRRRLRADRPLLLRLVG